MHRDDPEPKKERRGTHSTFGSLSSVSSIHTYPKSARFCGAFVLLWRIGNTLPINTKLIPHNASMLNTEINQGPGSIAEACYRFEQAG